MATIEELKELYQRAKYREIIAAVNVGELKPDSPEDEEKLLQVGWAHHQLGEYGNSVSIFVSLSKRYPADTEIGESARRGWAHGVLQWTGSITKADEIMQEIPSSLARDNVRMNMFIEAVRKGLEIPASEVMAIITNTLAAVPYSTVNGHIINNGALAFHEARKQGVVRPYLPILPGLIEVAIGIYETTGAAKNHIAGALFRASQIFEAADWKRRAIFVAEESVAIWRELVSAQDGARYQRNLEGAEKLLRELMMDVVRDNRPPSIDR